MLPAVNALPTLVAPPSPKTCCFRSSQTEQMDPVDLRGSRPSRSGKLSFGYYKRGKFDSFPPHQHWPAVHAKNQHHMIQCLTKLSKQIGTGFIFSPWLIQTLKHSVKSSTFSRNGPCVLLLGLWEMIPLENSSCFGSLSVDEVNRLLAFGAEQSKSNTRELFHGMHIAVWHFGMPAQTRETVRKEPPANTAPAEASNHDNSAERSDPCCPTSIITTARTKGKSEDTCPEPDIDIGNMIPSLEELRQEAQHPAPSLAKASKLGIVGEDGVKRRIGDDRILYLERYPDEVSVSYEQIDRHLRRGTITTRIALYPHDFEPVF
jgi:hypothetical protein